jgi:predicted Zn finger-like uncharacterized protein
MQIACPQCAAQYNVDEARIPPQGVQIKCPRCQHNFIVQDGGNVASQPDAVPLPGGGGAVPLPGGGGAVPLPGSSTGSGKGGAVPLPGSAKAAVPLPGAGAPAVPLPGTSKGAVPLPGASAGKGAGAAAGPPPAPAPAFKGGMPSMEDIFGTGAPTAVPSPEAPLPGHSMSMGDIFDDIGPGGAKDDSKRAQHPFHGTSVVVDAQSVGGDVLDFIDHAGKSTAEPKEEQFSIRKRSGRVLGPLSTSDVLAMFHKGELLGSEDASADGVTWRPLAQTQAFAQTIQQAMANALSGLDELPAPKGARGDDARGGSAAPDQPMVRDKQSRGGRASHATDPGLAIDTAQLLDAAAAKDAVARKRRKGSGKAFPLLAGGAVFAVVVAAGVAVNFVTEYGYFGYRLVVPEKPVIAPLPPPVVEAPPPPLALSATDTDYDELLRADTYLAYRQGAEQAARSVDAGKAATPFPASAARAAAQHVRFLSYLIHLEDLPVFVPSLRESLGYADGDEVAKAIGEAASAYADKQWDKGLAVLDPLTATTKMLAPAQKTEVFLWSGIGLRGKGSGTAATAAFDNALQASPRSRLAIYMQAAILAETAEPAVARGYVDKLLQESPDHPRGNILLGKLLSGRSDTLEEGKQLLTEISEGKKGEAASPPQRAQAYMGRAEMALAARQNAEALRYVSKAVELVPQNRAVRIAAAELALRVRDYPAAKEHAQKLLEQNAEDVDGLVIRARAAMGTRDTLTAYSELQAAAKKSPDNATINHWFGMAAREMSKLDEARAQFEKAAAADPKKADSIVEIVYDLIEQGKLTDAVKRAAAAEESVNAGERFKVRAAKAAAYARRRQFVQSEAGYQQALEENPRDTNTRAGYATMLVAQRRLDEADVVVNEATLFDAKSPAVIVAGGDVLAARGDFKGALGRYEEAMALAPNSYLPYLHAVRAAVELKDLGRAKGFADTAGQLRPGVAEVLAMQAVVGRASDPKQASRTMQQAIDKAPEEPIYPFELGVIFASMGAPLEAIDAFKKATALSADFVDAYYQLAKVQRDLVRTRDARESLDKAVSIDPKRADAWLEIADLLGQQGDDDGALGAYEKALRADPKNMVSVCNMGQTLVERMGSDDKNLKRGIEVLVQCTALAPNHLTAWKHLGNAYRQGGPKKRKDALSAYQKHQALNPDDADNALIDDYIRELGGRPK